MQEEMDPVMEVALWQEKNRIRHEIEVREKAVLLEHNPYVTQQMRQHMWQQVHNVHIEAMAQVEPVISLVTDDESDDSAATMVYPDAAPDKVSVSHEIPVAHRVPSASASTEFNPATGPKDPIVSKTIQNLWKSVEEMRSDDLQTM